MPVAVDTFAVYQELVPQFGEEGARALTAVLSHIIKDVAQTVTKEEFHLLRQTVADLAAAQERTEQRLEELAHAQQGTEQRLEELAHAQERTEQRLEELALAQQRTEQRLEELAHAQERTEQRLEELALAQQRTEQRLEGLAEAQRRTEKEVRSLAVAVKQTRTMLGGLSDSVGYLLEDRAIQALPRLLPELAGVTATEPFVRRFLVDERGELVELNVFGYGQRGGGEPVTVVGEAKARLKLKDIDDFRRLLGRLAGHPLVRGELLGILVSYQLRPEVEERAAQAGVLVVPSYRLVL